MPLTIAIDEELLARLKRIAEERGISVSSVVNEVIRRGLGSKAVGVEELKPAAGAGEEPKGAKSRSRK